MKRVIILTMVMALALAGTAWAVEPLTGPRITYAGYVCKYLDPQLIPVVSADTLICVINPNNFPIYNVGIAFYDETGLKVADAGLLGGVPGLPHSSIMAKGWVWRTPGQVVPPQEGPPPYLAKKYTWVVYWDKPTAGPNRGLIVEVKEIIYTVPRSGIMEYAYDCWMPELIRTWTEAALGAGGRITVKLGKGGGLSGLGFSGN